MDSNNLEYYQKLADIFLDKPEMVIDFPDWMLSAVKVAAYRELENPAIVEIAGRDSVAAAIKSVAEEGFTDLIPVYAYTGTEYGAWHSVIQAVERLAGRLPGIHVHPLMVTGSPIFWRALNGRFVSELIFRFGFYSPCPGCHLYLHVVRIPLAKMLGGIPIISGERELHNGQVKINQTKDALDVYHDLSGRFDIRLLLPLRTIEKSTDIERLLEMPWERDKDQLECAFSGNYRGCDSDVAVSIRDVRRFFTEFAIPTAQSVITEYINGKNPDAVEIARKILETFR